MEVVCKICIAQSWWEHTFTSRARPFASFFTEIVQVPSWFTGVGCPPRHVHAVSYSLCLQQKVNSFIEQQIVLCCKLRVHVLTQLTEWNSKLKGVIHKIKPFEHPLRLLTKTVTCLYTITVYLSKFSFSSNWRRIFIKDKRYFYQRIFKGTDLGLRGAEKWE